MNTTAYKTAAMLDYEIFNSIPHQRVISQTDTGEEIFDLFQLGIFTATSFTPFANPGEIKENIELVKLQPQSYYRPHFHKNSTAIIYIILGQGQFILGQENLAYHAGKRIVIPAGMMHGFQTTTLTLFLSMQSPPIIDAITGEIDIHYANGEHDVKS